MITHTVELAELPPGKFVCQRESAFEEGCPVYSVLLVCPICCCTWGKLTISVRPDRWVPQFAPCAICGWDSEETPIPHVAGSLIENQTFNSGVDWGLLEALPPDLLRREYLLTLRAFNL